MAAQEENLQDELSPAKHFPKDTAHANRPPKESNRISKVLDEGILLPKLGKQKARVRRQRANDA